MLEILVSFALATVALAFSPGPDNIYVLAQSLANGSKSGIATSLGLTTGCIIHTTLLAFGVSALITASPYIFFGIKALGAIYLLYLAYKVFKSDPSISFSKEAPKKSKLALFKQGFIMNLVNPKVMIFFLAFFPGFLWSSTQSTVIQFYVLGIIFMVVSMLVFGLISILAGSISSYLLNNSKVGVVLKWTQIIVFVGIAIFILIPDTL